MKRALVLIPLILKTSWRVDKRRTIAVVVEPLARLAGPLSAVFVAILINGAINDQSGSITLAIIGLTLAQGVVAASQHFGMRIRMTLAERVGFEFDRELIGAVARIPGIHHLHNVDLQNKLQQIRDNQGALAGSLNMLVNTANSLFVSLGILGVLIWINPLLLVLVAFAAPAFRTASQERKIQAATEQAVAPIARLARKLGELAVRPATNADLRLWGAKNLVVGEQREAWQKIISLRERTAADIAKLHIKRDLIFTIGYAVSIMFIAWMAYTGGVSLGAAAAAIIVGRLVQTQVLAPIATVNFFARVLRTVELSREVIQHSNDANNDGASFTTERNGEVPHRLKSVEFAYPGSNTQVLGSIDLELESGKVIALIGENGAGKSTLVNLIAGLYKPTSGCIEYRGNSGEDSPTEASISATFQDYSRFEFELSKTVGLGWIENLGNQDIARRAIHAAGADSLVRSLPQGLDTQLGSRWEGGVDLSGGQWQMTAISRSMVRPSKLIILDEPTASLDAHAEDDLLTVLSRRLNRARLEETTVLIVSHRMSSARLADVIVRLDGGKVMEIGSHDDLVDAGGEYARIYEMQRAAFE